MTTQQYERARLIKGLRDLRDIDFDDLFVKAAALLEADAKGGEAVAWQGRFLDMSDESSGWSSWRNIDPVDVEGWKRRCAQSDTYQMRPLYTRPQQAAQVPEEATAAMLDAYSRVIAMGSELDGSMVWRAMLAASRGIGKNQA